MFGTAMELFFRPFGSFLSEALRPFAKAGVDMATNFNDAYANGNLGVALVELGGDVVSTWATGFANAIADTVTGQASKGDLALLLGGGLTAAKLAGILPSIGLGTIFGSWGTTTAISSVLPSIGFGTLFSGWGTTAASSVLPSVSMGVLVGTGLTTAGLLGLLGGTIALADIVKGGKGIKEAYQFGEAFREAQPQMAETIRNIFTKNPAYDFGQWIAEGFNTNADNPTTNEEVEERMNELEDNVNLETRPIENLGPGGRRALTPEELRSVAGGDAGSRVDQTDLNPNERTSVSGGNFGSQTNLNANERRSVTGGGVTEEMRRTREEMTRELRRTREAIENMDVPVLDATDERFDPF
jgi:hypothetical protein